MKREYLPVAALLLFITVSGLYYAVTNSVTSDEPTHVTAGYLNIRYSDYRFNIEHPPFIKQLAALPLLFLKLGFPFSIYKTSTAAMDIVPIQNSFLYMAGNNLDTMLLLARLPNILIAMFLGLFVYMFSKRLNGIYAGIVSLALYSFSPSFLGHSPLVTMDTAVSCFCFVTIYYLMRFFDEDRHSFLVLTGVFLGLSLISKFSALVFVPIVYVLILVCGPYRVRTINSADVTRQVRNIIIFLPVLYLVLSYKDSVRLILPACIIYTASLIFYKNRAFAARFNFIGKALMVIFSIAFVIIILDYTDFKWFPFHGATKAYFKGFSSFDGHARGGQGVSYLMGKFYYDTGKWYYFPMAFIFKEPVAAIALILMGIFGLCAKKEDFRNKLFLLVPVLAYLFVSCFINKVNIGIRHLLPIYPFLYVIAGYSIVLIKRSRFVKYCIAALLAALIADVASAYPAHMSYFNRLTGGVRSGYKLLSDSNIAWGQDWKRLKCYLYKNNLKDVRIIAGSAAARDLDRLYIPYVPVAEREMTVPSKGIYVIETSTMPSNKVKWAKLLVPSRVVGGSLLIYDVSEKDIEAVLEEERAIK